MFKYIACAFLICGLSNLYSSEGTMQESHYIHLEAEAGFHSRYVDMGISQTDGSGMQSSISGRIGGFTLYFWNNVDLYRNGHTSALTEMEVGISYETEISFLTFTPGIAHYFYNAGFDDGSWEVIMEISAAASENVELFIEHVLDVYNNPGAYNFMLGAAYERQISGRTQTELKLFTGWGTAEYHEDNTNVRKAGWNVFGGEMSVQVEYSKIAFRPYITTIGLLDNTIRSEYNQPIIYGGVAMSVGL